MKKETFKVQAIYGDSFEDIYVKAVSEKDAIAKAKKKTTLKSRWTKFVL